LERRGRDSDWSTEALQEKERHQVQQFLGNFPHKFPHTHKMTLLHVRTKTYLTSSSLHILVDI